MKRRTPLPWLLATMALVACTKMVSPAADPGSPGDEEVPVVPDDGAPDLADPGPADEGPADLDPGTPDIPVVPDVPDVPPDPGAPDVPDVPEVGEDVPADLPGEEVCTPDCGVKGTPTERKCGPDGCGGICGYCQYGYACDLDGVCQKMCVPKCDGRVCGDDSCGGSCGTCSTDMECQSDGLCYPKVCKPDCTGKECGGDGCGGSCGDCPATQTCSADQKCVVGPCGGMALGQSRCSPDKHFLVSCVDDGSGQRLEQTDCTTDPKKECGWDGWAQAWGCVAKPPCQPDCTTAGKECGDDGCEGSCGACPTGWGCPAFHCRPVAGATCGWVNTMGWCSLDNWLFVCTSDDPYTGKIEAINCNAEGKFCAYVPVRQQFDCVQ